MQVDKKLVAKYVWTENAGNILFKLRKIEGLSRQDIATAIDNHQSYIQKLEKGEFETIPADTLYLICKIFKITIEEILN